MFKKSILALLLAVSSALTVAQETADFEVIITNITPGQTFTPQLVVTHPGTFQMFRLGLPASEAMEMMAEGGDTGPLTDEVANVAMDVQTIARLLEPGQTSRVVVAGVPRTGFITIVGMMIPTNDSFFALNRVRLPQTATALHFVPAYDAGTEENDQSCQNMPGPRCGGIGYTEETGEGFVHIGNGFHDLGDEDDEGFEVLGPKTYDWRNSVARIVVRRLPQ